MSGGTQAIDMGNGDIQCIHTFPSGIRHNDDPQDMMLQPLLYRPVRRAVRSSLDAAVYPLVCVHFGHDSFISLVMPACVFISLRSHHFPDMFTIFFL